ncbi:MAG: hypothetical protein HC781_12485 [Leptolyngbyaceae cyanobacterium CSU_1_4]|nr:hypothetical protein [Leptolyngbyaceae cyanobacterium CSU_1_4]
MASLGLLPKAAIVRRDAIAFHVEGLKLAGLAVPQPTTSSAYVGITA